MYSTASLTLLIFSASSSGISIPNSSSNAITSSTMSSESAPRSSVKLASRVTSSASTPSCSTMMLLTLSATAMGYPSSFSPFRGPVLTQRANASLSDLGGSGSDIEPARHVQGFAGNISCFLARQEDHGPGDVVDAPQPPE